MKVEVTKIKQHAIVHNNVGAEKGQIDGVVIKHLVSWPDDRGYFSEVFQV